jgi:Prenyltransferase and squalene oxidase repeat
VVDIDAAIGYVVAHGDPVDRARLSYLRTGAVPAPETIEKTEMGQTPGGGWPAFWGGDVASVDATCFRLLELDDLGALDRPPATRALDWLASAQRDDGGWEEDESLAAEAPPWARPGDPEAQLYLTALAAFWLTVVDIDVRPVFPAAPEPRRYAKGVRAAAELIVSRMRPDGTWPSFLAAGWYAAAVLHEQQFFYESARMQLVLGDRLGAMTPADVASMAAVLRRAGVGVDDWLLVAARRRLSETQRSDGGWPSDDGPAFDVHTTLTAIRAARS